MVRSSIRSSATHIGAFSVGAVIATAIAAHADGHSPLDKQRYQALDAFAHTLSLISSQYVVPKDDTALIYSAVRGMTEDLDKYSVFYDPDEHRRIREDIDGEYGGVGILDIVSVDTADPSPAFPRIDSVLADSPAARAGIRAGDRLMSVDGASTAAPDPRAEDADPETDWLSRLRGPLGTSVTVGVTRDTWDSPRVFELVRERLKIPSVAWFAPAPGIGYVAISRFQNATAADLEHALRELSKGDLRVLIFDLRNNPGGLLDQAVKVADMFIEQGTIVSIRGRAGTAVEVFAAHAAHTWTEPRMLVLIDERTASAAEIVTAALQDHGRATVMGLKSYGKGSVQSFFDLADGSGLKLTTAHYYSPKERSLEHHGITPDVQVESFAAEVIEAGSGNEGSDPDAASGPADQPQAPSWPGDSAVVRRLRGDHQFDTAYQTARSWLESKPTPPVRGTEETTR